MAGKGGKRPGAGRPKNSKRVISREMAAEILADNKCWEIWKGLLKSKNEKIRLEALKYLSDQTWGKALQPLGGYDGGPLELKVIYEDYADIKDTPADSTR